jgi:uncharacterized FlaG/YvyC family protein
MKEVTSKMSIEPIHISEKHAPRAVPPDFSGAEAMPAQRGESKRPIAEPKFSMATDLAAEVQKNLKAMHDVDLKFSVHKSSGRIMVTIINETTGEKIREIPPTELLNLAAKFEEMIGILFDQKG